MQELINKAILASVVARREWDLKPVQDRAQILFKAADVISGPKRAEILAKTMIGQVQETRGKLTEHSLSETRVVIFFRKSVFEQSRNTTECF